ncbi:TPA: TIR domain-containing protein [Pseudomonas aeruginosa]
MPFKVFISYAKEDRDQALKFYEKLVHEGVTPWLDVKNILPGQNWEAEIDKGLREAHVVMLLLSNNSVNKRGFVQREANESIARLVYKKLTDIYILPLILDDCEVPDHISGKVQYLDMRQAGAWERVFQSLKLAAEQQSLEYNKGMSVGPFSVFTKSISEQKDGSPGHDISVDYPVFESTVLSQACNELNYIFLGRAVEVLSSSRSRSWDQDTELFPVADGRSSNSRWDSFGVVYASENLISLTYEIGWYAAGAAHPNSYFQTYNFSLAQGISRLELEDFFVNMEQALHSIGKLCVDELCREYWRRNGEKPDETQLEWFKSGTAPHSSNFANFNIHSDHFTFLFPPYQVSAYAQGRWAVDVHFYDVLDHLSPIGPHTLT